MFIVCLSLPVFADISQASTIALGTCQILNKCLLYERMKDFENKGSVKWWEPKIVYVGPAANAC